jgi:hypothetical protein
MSDKTEMTDESLIESLRADIAKLNEHLDDANKRDILVQVTMTNRGASVGGLHLDAAYKQLAKPLIARV